VASDVSLFEFRNSPREDPGRVSIDLPAESDGLPFEVLSPTVNDSDYILENAMAAVSLRVGSERFAKNGQIVIGAEQRRQFVGLLRQVFLAIGQPGLNKPQLKQKTFGLFTPLVESLHARGVPPPKLASADLSDKRA
jgi:hypothetical protein